MKWCCRFFFACLLASITAVTLAAPPRLWFEAQVEPSTVPVNAQATYVQRFGHAVDVRAPRFDPPQARLAEILPLGQQREFEMTRDGLRYLVREQRFAILPFASGQLQLDTAVHGRTPAALTETGGRATFTLNAPTVRLTVTPASGGGDWLPASALQLSASGDAPATMKVGEVWTRQLLIEAVGVDGSVIAAPRWRESPDWTLQFDPPEVGRRVEAGRVIGFRQQTVHAQPRRAGRLEFPLATLDWWQLPIGVPARQTLAPAVVEVFPAASTTDSPIESARGDTPVKGSPASASPWSAAGLLFGLLLALVIGLAGLVRRESFRRLWRRHVLWKQLDLACRTNNVKETQRLLLLWVEEQEGGRVRSLGALADRCSRGSEINYPLFAETILELERCCYSRQPASWNGLAMRRILRKLT